MKVSDTNKLKFIDFLIKHRKQPTSFRMAMFDEIAKKDDFFVLEDIQKELQSKGHKAHNNSIYECGKYLAWFKAIEKIVVPDGIGGLEWKFKSNVNDI